MQNHVQQILQQMQKNLDNTAARYLAQNAKLVTAAQAAVQTKQQASTDTSSKKNPAQQKAAAEELKTAADNLTKLETRQKTWIDSFQQLHNNLQPKPAVNISATVNLAAKATAK